MLNIDPLDLYAVRSLLSDEERLIQDNVGRFVDTEVLPIIARCFADQRFPEELVPRLAELGLLGATVTGYGCAGLNSAGYGLVCQELERGDSSLRSFVSVQSSLVMGCIEAFGSETQKERWLPPMARGESLGCFGLTEAHGGSDPANMRTHARADGGDWIVNGGKAWITNGALADVAVVWAQTEQDIAAFLVERDMPGFDAHTVKDKFSLRASDTSELFFKDVRVPGSNRLAEAIGLKAALACLNQARFGIVWGAIGAARACLAEVLDYTSSRQLFGSVLAEKQLIQTRLAEMARRLTTAQLLAHRLAVLRDEGLASTAQISLAKWNNVRMALDIARDCRDILGGAGITVEHCAIRHMLNMESVVTYEGTESIHELVVGRALTGSSAF